MAKYSTGGGSSGESASCELCGAEGVDLQSATVAGAKLDVCGDCAQHGETDKRGSSGGGGGSRDDGERDRKRRAAQNAARMSDAAAGDSTHWEEEGTNYDDDQLPYLVAGYGDRLTEARQNAGLQLDELAAELETDESTLLAVEQGRATQAGVGGSLIGKLEQRLDVELAE